MRAVGRLALSTAVLTAAMTLTPLLTAPGGMAPAPAPAAAAPDPAEAPDPAQSGCEDDQLALVDRGPEVIDFAPLQDGSYVPLVLVHGLKSEAGTWDRDIDLDEDTPGRISDPDSLIGQLQGLGGSAVYTFDYSDVADEWVTHEDIGPHLAQSLECLQEHSGQQVIVVAHSMGGLATRQAFAENPDLPGMVSQVITYGTPNTGSPLANLSSALTWLIYSAMIDTSAPGASGTSPEDAEDLVEEMIGGAIPALAVGSDELAALPDWPEQVPVHALFGETSVTVGGLSLFAGPHPSGAGVDLGDVVVGSGSATASGSDTSDGVACQYDLHLIGSPDVRFSWGPDPVAANVRDGSPLGGDNPCYHGNLMSTIQLDDAAVDYISSDIQQRLELTLRGVPDELAGQWCTESDDPDCFSFAELGEDYPEWQMMDLTELATDEVTRIQVCLALDMGTSCTTAASMYFDYYPNGVEWDCAAHAEANDWPGCDPDFTDAHDPSRARLTRIPNHQHNEHYVDSEPMYRQ